MAKTKIKVSRIITIPYLFTLVILNGDDGRIKDVCFKTHWFTGQG